MGRDPATYPPPQYIVEITRQEKSQHLAALRTQVAFGRPFEEVPEHNGPQPTFGQSFDGTWGAAQDLRQARRPRSQFPQSLVPGCPIPAGLCSRTHKTPTTHAHNKASPSARRCSSCMPELQVAAPQRHALGLFERARASLRDLPVLRATCKISCSSKVILHWDPGWWFDWYLDLEHPATARKELQSAIVSIVWYTCHLVCDTVGRSSQTCGAKDLLAWALDGISSLAHEASIRLKARPFSHGASPRRGWVAQDAHGHRP